MEECIIIWKDSVSRSDDFTHTVLKPLPPLISLRGTGVPMETVSSTNPPRLKAETQQQLSAYPVI